MARQVIERLLCDVHDGEVDAVRTVEFGLNGKFYEVDLCEVHADELEGLVQEWSDFARSVTGRSSSRSARRGRGRSSRSNGKADVSSVRVWAKQQGMKISDRGRIPNEVLEKYNAAK